MLSIAHFWSMRRPVRSLVYLFWIYSFVIRAVTAFTQIYIYQVFTSVELNIVASIAMFTGCMIGFCVYGAIAAQCRLNAKHGFALSFIVTGLGLILLPFARDVMEACAAVSVRGIGFGLFWLTIHTYELMETRDHERDVYSTFASTGDQIVIVASPAFATLLIWLSQSLGAGDFTLLFFVTPPIFLLGCQPLARCPIIARCRSRSAISYTSLRTGTIRWPKFTSWAGRRRTFFSKLFFRSSRSSCSALR